jgi:trigger factor
VAEVLVVDDDVTVREVVVTYLRAGGHEVTEASEKQFKTQMLLDAIAESVNVSVSQDELTQYLVQSSAQYGMAPQDFVNALQENNQLPAIVGEVARNKALAVALGKVTVVDTNGNPVDPAGFVAVEDEAEAEDEVVEEAEKLVDAAAQRSVLDAWFPNPAERGVILKDTPQSLYRF